MSSLLDAAFGHFEAELANSDGAGQSEAKAFRVLDRCFRQQRELIADPARFKNLLCPRRSGKSTADLAYLLVTALRRPRTESVYLAGTRAQAKMIVWDDLIRWNHDLELGFVMNLQELNARAPNGSKITLGGAETESDVERYRGRRYALFVIDEPASLRPSILDGLIVKVVSPALQDHKGTLVLTGTPGHILDGLFWKTTGPGAFEISDGRAVSRPWGERDSAKWRDVAFDWSAHTWSVSENAAKPEMWAEALETKRRLQLSDEHPVWLREGVGRWATDEQKLLFGRFDPQRNTWERGKQTPTNPFGLPAGYEWRYVIGIDMGRTVDPFALCVVAFSDNHPAVYQCYEWQAWKVLPKDIAAAIQKIMDVVPVERAVADWGPYGSLIQEQLLTEYGMPVEAAEKRDKRDHVELLNGDYVDGRAFLLADSIAATQSLYLSWDDTGLKEATDRSAEGRIKNDCTDAWLYAMRFVRHHFAVPLEKLPAQGSPEHARLVEQQMIAELAERTEAMKRLTGHEDFYDRGFDD